MRILLIGFGKMGKIVAEEALTRGFALAGIVDRGIHSMPSPQIPLFDTLSDVALSQCDAVIEFAAPYDILSRIRQVMQKKIPYIIGTTGWEDMHADAKMIVNEEGGTLLTAPNFSLGVALFYKLCHSAAALFSPAKEYSCSLFERHHEEKIDTPSGTTKKLVQELTPFYPQLPFTCLRSGHFPGMHELVFDASADTIEIRHVARNRNGFASGALDAACWLQGKRGWFTFDNLIQEKFP